MAQLSRPYQIALAAVALLGLVWVVALRSHGSGASPSSSSSSAPVSHASSTPSRSSTPSSASTSSSSASSSAAAEAKSAASPTPIYHGATPGLEGLTRDIAKAHEAVGTSQREAHRFESESAQGGSSASSASTSTSATSAGHSAAPNRTVSTAAPTKPSKKTFGHPVQQLALERALARHKTVLLLFWNPKSSVDAKVRRETDGVARSSKGRIVDFDAQPNQVGLFGPVTEVTHVYETPTILIVTGHGLVSSRTGLTDGFALEQAVREAQHAK